MRRLTYSVLLSFVLFGSHHAAAQTGPDYACRGTGNKNFTVEDLARFVRSDGASNVLPGRVSENLGFAHSDLAVKRVGFFNKEAKTFKAIDVPSDSPDYVLIIRVADDGFFWRVTASGKTLKTMWAKKEGPYRLVPNSEYASLLKDLCNDLFDAIENEKKRKQ